MLQKSLKLGIFFKILATTWSLRFRDFCYFWFLFVVFAVPLVTIVKQTQKLNTSLLARMARFTWDGV